jgi:hypothetical protein
MSYWDGSRWTDESTRAKTTGARRANWAATAVMAIGALALLLPLTAASAASPKNAPTVATGCGAPCLVGSSLTVTGAGFTPSSLGQQVILWVEYPNDYCGALGCHGFYFNPWVNADGTFSTTLDNALLQAGEGGVEAIQYNARTDKWVKVAYVDYAAQ